MKNHKNLSTLTPSLRFEHSNPFIAATILFFRGHFFFTRDVTGPTKSLLPPIPKRWAVQAIHEAGLV